MSETASNTESNRFGTDDAVPSETVVRAVAAAEGLDETELPPLYDVCDPDALNAVFRSAEPRGDATTGTVEFEYQGYIVCVRDDGEVRLRE